MLVHIIADYGVSDLAFAEVVQRIKLYLPEAEHVLVPVPSLPPLHPASVSLSWGFTPARPAQSSSTTSRVVRTIQRPEREMLAND